MDNDLLPGDETDMFKRRPSGSAQVQGSVSDDDDDGSTFITYDPYTTGQFILPPLPDMLPLLLPQKQVSSCSRTSESTYKKAVDDFMKNKSTPLYRLDLLTRQFLYIYFNNKISEIQQDIEYKQSSPIVIENIIESPGYKEFKSMYEGSALTPESVMDIKMFTLQQKVFLCVYYFFKLNQLNLTQEQKNESSYLCTEGGGRKKMKKYRYSKKLKTKSKIKYKLQSRKRRRKYF